MRKLSFIQGVKVRMRRADKAFKKGFKNLGPIDVGASIDRVFRFLEMSFVAALLGVVYGIVSPDWAHFLTLAMSVAAGVYLGLPVARWIEPKKSSRQWTFMLATAFGFSSAMLVMPVQALVRATFSIDETAAVKEYARIQGRFAGMGCVQAHRWPPEQCAVEEKNTEREILQRHRLNAK